MCQYQPPCPPAGAPDHQAARVVARIRNRDGSCSATASLRSMTPASCFPLAAASPAPAGPPEGARPSAPAGPAGDRRRAAINAGPVIVASVIGDGRSASQAQQAVAAALKMSAGLPQSSRLFPACNDRT